MGESAASSAGPQRERRFRLFRGSLGFALFLALLGCLPAGTAAAKPKVYRSVPTHASFAVTRGDDGTITATVSFTSNPRCLPAKRFKRVGKKNLFPEILSTLLFGGPYTAEGESHPAGSLGEGRPPGEGTFSPVSPPGKSPYVWEAVFPGSAPVNVTNLQSTSERHYTTTVAAATALRILAAAPVSKGQGLPYFKAAYDQGGKRIILKCEPLAGATTEIFSGKAVVRTFYF
jgi:hypothetical protein